MESNTSGAGTQAGMSLDLVRAARATVADRLITPWWYGPIFAALVGGFVALYPIVPQPWPVVVLVLYLSGLALLVRVYKRVTGVWVSGFRKGATRPYAVGMGVVLGVCILASMWVHARTGLVWPSLLLGAAAGAIVWVFGHGFDRTLRAELRGELRSEQ